jgi:hypothetical protein
VEQSVEDGQAGKNFLAPEIFEVAKTRLKHKERHQTLGPTRLRNDLLSSMPMCFNLFGELSGNPERAKAVAEALLGHDPSAPTTVRFEWSPGRLEERYTNDRTAFDVALESGTPGNATIVGIETKYHEHAKTEQRPDGKKLARYREISDAGLNDQPVFVDNWESQILGKPLQQIWRDHLLVLSMLQTGDWKYGKYVLVYPYRNVSFRTAAEDYQRVLADPSTFIAVTVEQMIQRAPLSPTNEGAFKKRYLW